MPTTTRADPMGHCRAHGTSIPMLSLSMLLTASYNRQKPRAPATCPLRKPCLEISTEATAFQPDAFTKDVHPDVESNEKRLEQDAELAPAGIARRSGPVSELPSCCC